MKYFYWFIPDSTTESRGGTEHGGLGTTVISKDIETPSRILMINSMVDWSINVVRINDTSSW